MRIRGKRFTLTGILRPTGVQDDDLLIADLNAVQELLGRPDELTLIEVAAVYSGASVDQIVRQLSAALPDAEVTTVREAVQSRMHAVNEFKGFSLAIVGIVVGIEVLVVFLTMMSSVSERTTEIGVFRAIGFRRAQITRLVLIEAVVAGVIAGVLGYVVGMAVTYAVLPCSLRARRSPGCRCSAWPPWRTAALTGALAALYRRSAPASSTPPRRCARCERGRPF